MANFLNITKRFILSSLLMAFLLLLSGCDTNIDLSVIPQKLLEQAANNAEIKIKINSEGKADVRYEISEEEMKNQYALLIDQIVANYYFETQYRAFNKQIDSAGIKFTKPEAEAGLYKVEAPDDAKLKSYEPKYSKKENRLYYYNYNTPGFNLNAIGYGDFKKTLTAILNNRAHALEDKLNEKPHLNIRKNVIDSGKSAQDIEDLARNQALEIIRNNTDSLGTATDNHIHVEVEVPEAEVPEVEVPEVEM